METIIVNDIDNLINISFNPDFNTSFSKYDVIVSFLNQKYGVENVNVKRDEHYIEVIDYKIHFNPDNILILKSGKLLKKWDFESHFTIEVDGKQFGFWYSQGIARILDYTFPHQHCFFDFLNGNQYLFSIKRMIKENLLCCHN